MELELQTINALAAEAPACFVADEERRYNAELAQLAASLASSPETRVLLLAGPSSSGKTTTANLLADRLTAMAHPCAVVSLDNFYRNRDESYPKNPDGTFDYENVTALNVPLIAECLQHVIARRDCWLPRYDFKTSLRTDRAQLLPAQENGLVIVEGLHAMNPVISESLPKFAICNVFVSVSTNINENGVRILSGRKIRFLRRMVRDALYRGASVAHTLSLWPNVVAGEDRYLYPYKSRADVAFDTFHRYEVGVLAHYARGFAPNVIGSEFLDYVMNGASKFCAVDPELVPQDSLIREFIPGGIYEHIY